MGAPSLLNGSFPPALEYQQTEHYQSVNRFKPLFRDLARPLHLDPREHETGRAIMKAAFAHWDHRIAPVFDTARRVHVAEAEAGRIVAQKEEILADDLPVHKAGRLAELGVDTLVCGAITRSLRAIVASYGIRVIPFVAGDLAEVIQAWLRGGLEGGGFVMPGCRGGGGVRRGNAWGLDQEGYPMNGRGRGGTGPGGGQGRGLGRGRGGQGRGRLGGPRLGGVGGACLCPKCGHREAHEAGVPCVRKTCPECGTAMTRE